MNGIERAQDLGTLILGAVFAPDCLRCQDVADVIASEYKFEQETPMKLRHFAIGLHQLADAVDKQAVLVAEALAEIECAEPTPEETLGRNRSFLRGDSADIEGL